jgi:hypothetical protein
VIYAVIALGLLISAIAVAAVLDYRRICRRDSARWAAAEPHLGKTRLP